MTIPENKPALDELQNTEVQYIEQLEQEQKQSNSSDCGLQVLMLLKSQRKRLMLLVI